LPFSTDIVPKSFKIDSEDNLYILDIFSENVVVLDSAGQYLKHLAFPEDFGFFTDLAVDSKGSVFLLDAVEAVIYSAGSSATEFSPLTERLKEYINFPTSLATDEEGQIYVVDQYGSGVALIGADGSFLGRKVGTGWREGLLYYPTQICISDEGIILVADRSNGRVQLFTFVGKPVDEPVDE
jgi:DNA-binding beta-propeller fold protein YncE